MAPATIPAQQVIAEIKAALNDGLSKHSSLALEKVELSLKTLIEKNVGAGISFTVPLINFEFEGGGDLTEESLQTLNLTLVPPPTQRETTKVFESFSIQQQLVEGIEAIAELVEQAGKGEPKLAMSSSKTLHLRWTHNPPSASGKAQPAKHNSRESRA